MNTASSHQYNDLQSLYKTCILEACNFLNFTGNFETALSCTIVIALS